MHLRVVLKRRKHLNREFFRGNYERMEFLGDAILKYTSSDYLYKHFPTHQEGHLTLLRSSLVNARCLAQAARELGLNNFIIYKSYKVRTVTKFSNTLAQRSVNVSFA